MKLLVTVDCLRLDASRRLYELLAKLLRGYVELAYSPAFTQGAPTPPSIFNYMLFGRFGAYYSRRLGVLLDYSRLPSVARVLARRGWATALIVGFNPYLFKFFGWARQFQYHYAIGGRIEAVLPRRLGLARRLKRLTSKPAPIDLIGLVSALAGRAASSQLRCPPLNASSTADWKPVRESIIVAREVIKYAKSIGSRSILVWMHVNDLHTPLYNPHRRSLGDCLAENIIDSLVGPLNARSFSAQLVASRATSLYWENVKVVAAAISSMIKRLLEEAPEGEVDLLILGDHGEGILSQPPPWEPEARRGVLVFGHEQLTLDLYYTGIIYSRGLLEYTPRVAGYAAAAAAVKEASLAGVLSEYRLRRMLSPYLDYETGRGLVASESAIVDVRVRRLRPIAALTADGVVVSSIGWCVEVRERDGWMRVEESWRCEPPRLAELLEAEHKTLVGVGSSLLLAR